MTDKRPHPTRTVSDVSPRFNNINSLVAATNKNDRFKLLEDESITLGDLDNPIHPIFRSLDCDGPRKRTFQLASQFLTFDSVLAFFIPLLYGHELTDSRSGKTYLSDPSANVSDAKRNNYITGIHKALRCLAHCVEIRFEKPEKRRKVGVRIEIADVFDDFYNDGGGYAASSHCGQLRHDFLFAVTILHEIVHAVGVMRRGHLVEPCCRLQDPDIEWGYSWENFMFGGIINPQDRTRPGTHLLMRKIWAGSKIADAAGGKEYCDVPMSYVAQWFCKSTWEIIEKSDPTAIPLPVSHFKIQASMKLNRWIVLTDCKDTRQSIRDLQREWNQRAREEEANGRPQATSHKITWRLRTKEQLQESNVPIPLRVARRRGSLNKCLKGAKKIQGAPQQEPLAVCRSSSPNKARNSRKRGADPCQESDRPSKVIKQ
ncbi:hypothetical protein P153DRAFT_376198 [Dothidotthia symphoricarpi CBS 119687]|uniref:Uncharacterized protein n=1 Tax=Dothidotthia symphoricarpi CBS 119687 TaxID=1392245 RepID=A0A6A6AD76_9PLEO|nr:uncharacterized protein P153DRAFT_376198 [Dothidotthia symphoricarpi CBS 119687]KAF2128827.1 hypothetical protein P153DRAFT_376198 [Dothidotthia symphoricarpi CBS 119687]